MKQQRFLVTRFENRNGVNSWRVDGRLGGVRIRRNFKTREEAAAEKAALELKSEQLDAGLNSVMTCLTAEQVRDAEAAIRRFPDQRHSLAFCVEYIFDVAFQFFHNRFPRISSGELDSVLEFLLVGFR